MGGTRALPPPLRSFLWLKSDVAQPGELPREVTDPGGGADDMSPRQRPAYSAARPSGVAMRRCCVREITSPWQERERGADQSARPSALVNRFTIDGTKRATADRPAGVGTPRPVRSSLFSRDSEFLRRARHPDEAAVLGGKRAPVGGRDDGPAGVGRPDGGEVDGLGKRQPLPVPGVRREQNSAVRADGPADQFGRCGESRQRRLRSGRHPVPGGPACARPLDNASRGEAPANGRAGRHGGEAGALVAGERPGTQRVGLCRRCGRRRRRYTSSRRRNKRDCPVPRPNVSVTWPAKPPHEKHQPSPTPYRAMLHFTQRCTAGSVLAVRRGEERGTPWGGSGSHHGRSVTHPSSRRLSSLER